MRRRRSTISSSVESLETRQLMTFDATVGVYAVDGASNPASIIYRTNPPANAPTGVHFTFKKSGPDSVSAYDLQLSYSVDVTPNIPNSYAISYKDNSNTSFTVTPGVTYNNVYDVYVQAINTSTPVTQDETVTLTISSATSSCGGSNIWTRMPVSAAITIKAASPSTTTPTPPQVNNRGQSCPTDQAADLATAGTPPLPSVRSGAGIDASSGAAETDPLLFSSDGFGQTWGVATDWTTQTDLAAGATFGNGVINTFQPMLQPTANGGYRVVSTASDVLWFDPNGSGGYKPAFFDQTGQQKLVMNADGNFSLTDPQGVVMTFYGFGSSIPTAQRGQFASRKDPNGQQTTTTYNATGQLTSQQRNDGTNSEAFYYSYINGSGPNNGLTSQVTWVQNQATVRTSTFTYYDGTQQFGNARDLQYEKTYDASNTLIDTTYYRYYTPADAGSGGYVGGLKYMFQPEAYARLAAAFPNPAASSDSQVGTYADTNYEYDSSHRVVTARIQGAGCSCSGSSGQGTYTYSYSINPNAATVQANAGANTKLYNLWTAKTVETLPDQNQIIYYTNFAGELMLKAESVLTDDANPGLQGKVWATYYRYDTGATGGRLILTAQPSAVTITSPSILATAEGYNDLVGLNGSNAYQYLAANAGRIDQIVYGTGTSASATTIGDVLGYVQNLYTKNGYNGALIPLGSTQYISHTDANGNVVYKVAAEATYHNADGSGAILTTYAYAWYGNTNQVYSISTQLPVISAAQNGPGGPAVNLLATVYDSYGRATWTRDEDGFINYYAYANASGGVVTSIIDVNTAQTQNFANLPASWSTPAGGGLNLTTNYLLDPLGRTTRETDPVNNVTWWVYNDADHSVRTYRGWNAATGTVTGPIEEVREDRAGSYVEYLTMNATPTTWGSAGSYYPTGVEQFSGIQSLTRIKLDKGGRAVEQDDYINAPPLSSGSDFVNYFYQGSVGTDYRPTTYGYDHMGRRSVVTNAVGTIRITKYDALGRAAGDYVGTDMTGFYTGTGGNMALVTAYQYDKGMVGDGNLTQMTAYVSSSQTRVTQYAYDFRDRLVVAKAGVMLDANGMQANEDAATNRLLLVWGYDNLDELVSVAQYDGDGLPLSTLPSMSLLRAYSTMAYDDLGQVYLQRTYSVNQATGNISSDAATNSLVTSIFYDRRGNTVATYAPGGLVTKANYDGAGRLVLESATDGAGGTAWSNALTTSGDHVLSQSRITYDAASRPILVAQAERFHDAPAAATGDLTYPTNDRVSINGTPISRVSYSTAYYDAADRVTATVDIGTNGGTTYSRPAAAPTPSDLALVTSYGYDVGGRLGTLTDPRGLVTKNTYDLLGRVTQTIAGYNAAINGGQPTASANATTNYTYDGIDHVRTVTAVMPSGTPSQTTYYIYGSTRTTAGDGLATNDWLWSIVQPDKATGVAPTSNGSAYQSIFVYNTQGDVGASSDPNGTTHVYSYDVMGRRTSDAIVVLPSGVDGTILRRDTAYDGAGRAYRFTTFNASSGGSAITDVLDTYNGFGQLTAEYQEQAGLASPSTSLAVRYTYTEMVGGQNNSRLTKMTYPNGRVVDYTYNAGIDTAISRVSAIADDSNGTPTTTLEGYSYLGLDSVVERLHPQTTVNLTYVRQGTDPLANGDGGDQYTGLDRFGRVIDQNWNRTGGGTAARYQYGYDRDGNALYRKDLVAAALSELYHANSSGTGDDNTAYDALGRLTGFARGVLTNSANNGGKLDTVSGPTNTQSWSLDALGNWNGTTKDGVTTSKTFNAANQANTATFDNNGNTLTDSGKTYTYDAWNRLKSVRDSSGTVVAGYAYDALDRRVVEVNSTTTKFIYFTPGGQVIEERTGGLAAGNVSTQYVWGVTGALVLRDSYSSGVLSTSSRLYALNNANGDIMALVDPSGTVQERYAYDAYGTVTFLDSTGTAKGVNASTYGWRYLFQGGRSDAATGLYVFGYRDYDPTQGRWIERDPLGLAAGDINIYRFVGNNPANLTDGYGLFSGPPSGGYGGGGWNPANWPRWAYTGDPNAPDEYYNAGLEGQAPVYTATYNDIAHPASVILSVASQDPGAAGLLATGTNIVLATVLNPNVNDPNSREPIVYLAAGPTPSGKPFIIIARPIVRGPAIPPVSSPIPMRPPSSTAPRPPISRNPVPKGPAGGKSCPPIDPNLKSTISPQKQQRHLYGPTSPNYRGGGYFNNSADPQKVLDAYLGGKASYLGTGNNMVVVRVPSVTGINHNPGAGFFNQPTNVFGIKGTTSPSVVPLSPTWKQ